MRLRDINTRDSFSVWAEILGGEKIAEGSAFFRYTGYANEYSLFYGGESLLRVKLIEDGSEISVNNLNHYLSRGGSCLAESVASDSDRRIQLRLVFFSGVIAEFGDVEIGISEKTAEQAAKSGIFRGETVTEELCAELGRMCDITVGDRSYFAVRRAEDFSGNDDGEKDSKNFQVCGSSVNINAQKTTANGREIFFATRTRFTNQRIEGALTLAHGRLTFTDYSKAAQIRVLAAQAMEQLTSSPESYLRTWEIYADSERRIEIERVHKAGAMKITGRETHSGFTRVFASGINVEALREKDSVEFWSEIPSFMGLTVDEHINILKSDKDSHKDIRFHEVVRVHKDYVDLKTCESEGGYLVLSTHGDDVRHNRRSQAIALMKSGRSANPMLGLILEKGGVLPKAVAVQRLKPITPLLEEKIFRYPPTERQREAIDIALNTPDIALIQGPPGTGKTTVITAIIERLNQEFDKRGVTRGQVLVSAFQHDAVANIVGRLRVNSLPAYKFGGKNDPESDSSYDSEGEIERWCNDLAAAIRQKNPQVSAIRDSQELDSLTTAYCESPSTSSALSLMQKITSIPGVKARPELFRQANAIISSLNAQENEDTSPPIIRKIFALRTTKTGFLDDGQERAIDLYEALSEEEYSDETVMSLLRRAGMWDKDTPPDFLPELSRLVARLIAEFKPSVRYVEEKTRSDVLTTANDAASLLKSQHDSYSDSEKILADFLLDIENNPEGIREAVKDYQFVYSATVQQSVGKEIDRQIQRLGDKARDFYSMVADAGEGTIRFPVYDTIIVDEAARALPMDLLIPMVQGKNRIILVGDHRQLPHIIDQDIADKIDSEQGDDRTRQYLEHSMFSYLFGRLKDLESKDGVKRTVTLDSQYRMHPVLGEFVSRNFYEQYGEGFKSPVGAEKFTYSLPGLEGKAATWLDVPVRLGTEILQGTSRARRAEAEVIAEYLSSWIESDSGKDYTFGVISFYSAQRDMIQQALERNGVSLSDNKARLQVGTVDAFQGKEFDIVILSAVRTGQTGKSARGTFGHLMSENRLCVSMSRQKRALIIAGCGELFSSDFAAENVPAMYNFYDLCRKEGTMFSA